MKLVLVGAGGHARSLLDAIQLAGEHDVVGLTDPRPELHGQFVESSPVLGDDSLLNSLLADGVSGAVLAIGAVGDNRLRQELFDDLAERGFELPAVIHPRATVAASAAVGEGSVVLAGAIVGPGAQVGRNVIVNTAAIVEHDCRIGDHVHLATACALGGHTVVGVGAHVGIGASVRQAIKIGAHAVVGAGAAVVQGVPVGVTVVGVPARAQP